MYEANHFAEIEEEFNSNPILYDLQKGTHNED